MLNHDLTTAPIKGLIRKIAMPVVIGFFFNTMFNVVDTYFGGQISPTALAALSLSFPIFFLIIIFDAGMSTGITALIANALGAKKHEEVEKYTAQAISFGIIISIFLTIGGILISPILFKVLGAQGEYLRLAMDYISIIFYGSVFFMMISVFNSLLQARGNTKILRNFMIVGFFLNVIFDPWFLYGGFGVPALGIGGIAFATILVQIIGTIYLLSRVIKAGIVNKDTFKKMIPEPKVFGEILKQALPASVNLATIGIGIFIITYFISPFGETAVAAYGIATRIEQIALLPVIGITIACLSIVGQNNGAKKYDRITETYKLCLKYGIAIMTVGMILIFAFAKQAMQFFTNDLEIIAIGAHYLKIASFITIAYPLLSITISALQGMKKPMYAVWIGVYRQILAPIIIFTIFSKILGFGIDGVWWGVFGITWSAAIFTAIYARKILVQNKTPI